MTTNNRKPGRRGAAVADRDDITLEGLPPANRIICACTNMTFGQLEEAVGKVQNHSFDALLEETGAGKTCTACLLDLEYYFVDLKARAPRQSDGEAGGRPDRAIRVMSRTVSLARRRRGNPGSIVRMTGSIRFRHRSPGRRPTTSRSWPGRTSKPGSPSPIMICCSTNARARR